MAEINPGLTALELGRSLPVETSFRPARPDSIVQATSERWFELKSRGLCREIAGTLKRTQPLIRLSQNGVSFVTRVKDTSFGAQLEMRLVEMVRMRPGPVECRVSHFGVVFFFDGELNGTTVRVQRILTLDRRLVSRLRVPSKGAFLDWVALVSGRMAPVRNQIYDWTPDGFRIRVAPTDPPLPPGPLAVSVHIGELKATCLAEYVRSEGSPPHVMACLRSMTRPTGELVEAYLRYRFPHLLERKDVAAEELGKLLEQSGYLDLRDGNSVSESWHKAALDQFGSRDMVYRANDNTLLGHASVTRIYPNGWLMHQLATLGGHTDSGICRMDLYGLVSTFPALVQSDRVSVIAYFDPTTSWHRTFFQGFLEWTNDPSLATITGFDRFEDDSKDASISEGSKAIVRPIAPDDLLGVTTLVRSQLPRIVADVMNIHPVHLSGALVQNESNRHREVLVLTSSEELVGAALCEGGSTSLSLFNILNIAQMYFSESATQADQTLLLHAVRRFYSERGIENPLIVAPPGVFRPDAATGMKRVETMGCIVISGNGLKQWENYNSFQFGRRWKRNLAKHD